VELSRQDAALMEQIAEKTGQNWHEVMSDLLHNFLWGYTPALRQTARTMLGDIANRCMTLAQRSGPEAAGELREIRGVALALSLAIRETPVPAKVFFGEVLQERRTA
jgi:hypothetical protein